MKTGRLLKFRRTGATVEAYVYAEAGGCRVAVYIAEADRAGPEAVLEAGDTEAALRALRAWMDERFPRP